MGQFSFSLSFWIEKCGLYVAADVALFSLHFLRRFVTMRFLHGNVNIHLQLLLKSWKWSFCDTWTHPFSSILPRPPVTFSLFASWHHGIPWSRTVLPRSLTASLPTSLVLSFQDSQMHTPWRDSSAFSFSFLPSHLPPVSSHFPSSLLSFPPPPAGTWPRPYNLDTPQASRSLCFLLLPLAEVLCLTDTSGAFGEPSSRSNAIMIIPIFVDSFH